MADYKLQRGNGVLRRSNGAQIPNDPRNRDWRKYQRWLQAGNTPDPADPKRPLIDTEAELAQQINSATTLDQLKQALLGAGQRKAKVAATPNR